MRFAAYFGDVPDTADAMAADVAKVFGGSTVLEGTGRWYDPEGNLWAERCHIVETFSADTVANRQRFKRLAKVAINATDEQSVMVVIGEESNFIG